MQGPAPPGAGCGWLNEELKNVSCFWFGLSIGRRDHIDRGCLGVGLLVGLIGQREVEEAFVERTT